MFSAARREEVRTAAKYQVIYRQGEQYSVSLMCRFFEVSHSGYCDFVKRFAKPDADAPLAEMTDDRQKHCGKPYGYRRVWLWLLNQGI